MMKKSMSFCSLSGTGFCFKICLSRPITLAPSVGRRDFSSVPSCSNRQERLNGLWPINTIVAFVCCIQTIYLGLLGLNPSADYPRFSSLILLVSSSRTPTFFTSERVPKIRPLCLSSSFKANGPVFRLAVNWILCVSHLSQDRLAAESFTPNLIQPRSRGNRGAESKPACTFGIRRSTLIHLTARGVMANCFFCVGSFPGRIYRKIDLKDDDKRDWSRRAT